MFCRHLCNLRVFDWTRFAGKYWVERILTRQHGRGSPAVPGVVPENCTRGSAVSGSGHRVGHHDCSWAACRPTETFVRLTALVLAQQRAAASRRIWDGLQLWATLHTSNVSCLRVLWCTALHHSYNEQRHGHMDTWTHTRNQTHTHTLTDAHRQADRGSQHTLSTLLYIWGLEKQTNHRLELTSIIKVRSTILLAKCTQTHFHNSYDWLATFIVSGVCNSARNAYLPKNQ